MCACLPASDSTWTCAQDQHAAEAAACSLQAAGQPLKHVRELSTPGSRDQDCLAPLIAEALGSGGCVLVFCPSRKQCQACARLVLGQLPTFLGPAFEVTVARGSHIPKP